MFAAIDSSAVDVALESVPSPPESPPPPPPTVKAAGTPSPPSEPPTKQASLLQFVPDRYAKLFPGIVIDSLDPDAKTAMVGAALNYTLEFYGVEANHPAWVLGGAVAFFAFLKFQKRGRSPPPHPDPAEMREEEMRVKLQNQMDLEAEILRRSREGRQ